MGLILARLHGYLGWRMTETDTTQAGAAYAHSLGAAVRLTELQLS